MSRAPYGIDRVLGPLESSFNSQSGLRSGSAENHFLRSVCGDDLMVLDWNERAAGQHTT